MFQTLDFWLYQHVRPYRMLLTRRELIEWQHTRDHEANYLAGEYRETILTESNERKLPFGISLEGLRPATFCLFDRGELERYFIPVLNRQLAGTSNLMAEWMEDHVDIYGSVYPGLTIKERPPDPPSIK